MCQVLRVTCYLFANKHFYYNPFYVKIKETNTQYLKLIINWKVVEGDVVKPFDNH